MSLAKSNSTFSCHLSHLSLPQRVGQWDSEKKKESASESKYL